MRTTIYKTQTQKRVLYIVQTQHGVFNAYYQPLNPKTGKPWQAHRSIEAGQDVHVLWNRDDFVVHANPAPFHSGVNWTENGRWNNGYCAFSTQELALAALQKYVK